MIDVFNGVLLCDFFGNRLSRVTKNRKGEVVSKENRAYDRFGRLAETAAGFGSKVTYTYDSKGRLARQVVDGSPIDYEYTKYGQLAGKYLGGKQNPEASVEYEYSKSGQIVARTANGARQTYEYDGRGQLLAVKNADGSDAERYAYDKAGNMVRKTVGGKTTTFTFDGANQLAYGVNSPAEGVDLLGCSWYWPFGDDETRELVAVISGQSIPIQGALGKTLLCGQSSELTVETQAVSMSIKVSPTINQVTGGLSQALISLVTGQTFTATIDIKPGTEKLPISYTCDAHKHASATSKKGSATFVPEIVAVIWIYAVYNGSEGGTFSDGSNRPVRFETETTYSIKARMIEATECVE